MSYLLDTHAALWWLMEPANLGPKARQAMEDPDNEIFISAVSMFEIAQKARIGKLPYPPELIAALPQLFHDQSWRPLEISIPHAARAGSLEAAHRDPFDRLLAAQAELENLTLLTRDPVFRDFSVKTAW